MKSGARGYLENIGGGQRSGFGYVRVSTGQQAESGLSLVEQETKIKAWAMINNVTLLNIFADEGISGKTKEKRPEFMKLLEAIRPGHLVITWSLSRLSRSAKDALQLYDDLTATGAFFVSLKENFDTSTHTGRFFFTVLAGVNELECGMISERTKAAMSRMDELGRANGRPPYGWTSRDRSKKGAGFVPVEEEQKVIAIIFTLKEKGLSPAEIAKKLNDEQIDPPKKAKKWYQTTINNITFRGYNVNVKGNPKIEKEGKNDQ